MKKVIAIVLAMIMLFSTGIVAFAADSDASAETSAVEETTEESFDPMDLPAWTIPVALKLGKIALKLAKVFVKIGTIFGIVDKGDLVNKITDFINGLTKNDDTEAETAPAAQVA